MPQYVYISLPLIGKSFFPTPHSIRVQAIGEQGGVSMLTYGASSFVLEGGHSKKFD